MTNGIRVSLKFKGHNEFNNFSPTPFSLKLLVCVSSLSCVSINCEMAASWECPSLPMLNLSLKESEQTSFLGIKPVSIHRCLCVHGIYSIKKDS